MHIGHTASREAVHHLTVALYPTVIEQIAQLRLRDGFHGNVFTANSETYRSIGFAFQ